MSEPLLLSIRVQPGAQKRRALNQNGRLKLYVPQPAYEGKANQAVLELVAKALSLKKSQVLLHHGQKSRDKTVAVHGWSGSVAQAQEVIAARWG
jgi:uncharacterized protein (TIGR00251 family)